MSLIKLDAFGIGASQFMALDLFENASRASGRTTMTIESAAPGDAIVAPNDASRRLLVSGLRERGLKVTQHIMGHTADDVLVVAIDPNKDHRLQMGTNPHGHTYLTHEYVEEVYRLGLRQIARRLELTETDLSSFKAEPKSEHASGARMRAMAYGHHLL